MAIIPYVPSTVGYGQYSYSEDLQGQTGRTSEVFHTALANLIDNLKIAAFSVGSLLFSKGHSDCKQNNTYYKLDIKFKRALKEQGFSKGNLLGAGNFGKVYFSQGSASTKEKDVAIKILKPFTEPTLSKEKGEGIALFLPEKSHLARAYGAFVWDENNEQVHYVTRETAAQHLGCQIIATVAEKQAGSLGSAMKKGELNIGAIRGYGRNTAVAIHALHQKGLLHLDIKPDNILLKEGEGHRIKLTDFGLSLPENSKDKPGGTIEFVAPELLKGEAPTKSADWYSFGMNLYAMVTGETPKVTRGRNGQLTRWINEDTIRDVNPQLHSLLFNKENGILNPDPNKRMSGEKVLAHPFFARG